MLWNQWYSLRSYVRTSLWVVPFIALLLYVVAIRLAFVLEAWVAWEPVWPWGLAGTQMMLQTIITLTLTFMVFTFGSLLVAIQIAGGQLTPRIIAATLLGDNAIRFTVGLFIFTFLFATGALARLEGTVDRAVAGMAGLLGFGSIAAFLYLIDYAARLLRPVSILQRVGEDARAVIESVYPEPAKDPSVSASRPPKLPAPDRTILHQGSSAIVLAVNLKALVAMADRSNTLIELAPRVGDFVAVGDPLFRLYGAGPIDERRLRGMVAFGPERTIEQDSTFAFRIIVDIAIKALSKAINDPTTAVLAIDQLQRLLRTVGARNLHDEVIRDAAGRLRVIFRTPNWEDFVQLSFAEIRLYGAENFQIARRLRAMIESLSQTLPDHRRPALRAELDLLDCMVEKLYGFPQDVALARTPDPQGLGGASREMALAQV
ncbi:MAG TPA: DUF2254 domain-containing protein [Dongiaceae bacterium]